MADPNTLDIPTMPRLAFELIKRCAPEEFRDSLLGDIQEEFSTQTLSSKRAANNWLWMEVLRSLPSLLQHRVRQIKFTRIGLLFCAYMVAYLAITLWDTQISRGVVSTLAVSDNPPSLLWLRTGYFILFTIGAFIAGFLSAPLGFNRDKSFLYNIILCFGPVFLMLNATIFYRVFASGNLEAIPYLAFRSFVLAATLAAGAAVFQRGRRTLFRR